MAWTVEDLTASVKRRAHIPTAQVTFTAADFIAIANEELQTYVVPLIVSQREDYFIAHYDVLLSNGVTQYRLPTRACGAALRDVAIITPQSTLQSFPRIARESLEAAPTGFYLDGNLLSLAVDDPSTVGQIGSALRMTYHMRPNTLVASSAVGVVQSINAGTRQVTLVSAPGAFTSSAPYDFIRSDPAFDVLGIDGIASVAGTTMTFTNVLPPELVVGDVIALAGQSNIPQVPPEAHSLLAQRVAVKCLEAQGDSEHIQIASAALTRLEQDLVKLITPRVAGKVERIINRKSAFRSWR